MICFVMSQSSAPTTSSQQSTPSTPLSQSDVTKRNKEASRSTSDCLQWAVDEGIGEHFRLTDASGEGWPGKIYCNLRVTTSPLQTIWMVKVINSAQQCCACCLFFCEFNFPQMRRYPHVQVEACRNMPQHAVACRSTRNFYKGPHMPVDVPPPEPQYPHPPGSFPTPCRSPGGGGGGRHLVNPKFFVAAHCVVVWVAVLWGTTTCIPCIHGRTFCSLSLKWNLIAQPCFPLGQV